MLYSLRHAIGKGTERTSEEDCPGDGSIDYVVADPRGCHSTTVETRDSSRIESSDGGENDYFVKPELNQHRTQDDAERFTDSDHEKERRRPE